MFNEELVKAYRGGSSEALEQLYFSNKGLMLQAFRRYGAGLEAEDVLQECFFAVANAAELYREEAGSFSHYLSLWLKQAILRYRDNCGGVIRVPGNQRARIRKYKKTVTEYKTLTGRDPSGEELARLLDLTPEELEDVKRDALTLQTVSTAVPVDDAGHTLEEALPAEGDQIGEMIDRIQAEELARVLWSVVDELPERKSRVIRERYREGHTLRECGEALEVSAETVRQIEAEALRDLRKKRNAERLRPFAVYSEGVKGTGLQAFRRTGTSAQERILLRQEELAERRRRLEEETALFRAGRPKK